METRPLTLADDTAGLALRGRARPWDTLVAARRREDGSNAATTTGAVGAGAAAAGRKSPRNMVDVYVQAGSVGAIREGGSDKRGEGEKGDGEGRLGERGAGTGSDVVQEGCIDGKKHTSLGFQGPWYILRRTSLGRLVLLTYIGRHHRGKRYVVSRLNKTAVAESSTPSTAVRATDCSGVAPNSNSKPLRTNDAIPQILMPCVN